MENLPKNVTPLLALYGSLVLSLFAAGLLVWGWLLLRLIRREPILPREPRNPVPWGLVDLILALALLIGLSIAAPQIVPLQGKIDAKSAKPVVEQLTLPDARRMIALDSGIKLAVMLLVIAAVTIRLRPRPADWGLSLAHWRQDLLIGGLTFLAIYLPMIAVQFLLVNGLNWKYDHPLIELVTRTKDPLLFALAALAAALMAPLFEEFIFRGLLQGWLEKLFCGRATGEALLVGGTTEFADLTAALLPAKEAGPEEPLLLPDTRFEPLAIVCSMLVFSLLHYSHGPAWIPLLLFGAAIGWVYQRTHRLWPGIFAHLLLNGVTMLGLWAQTFG